MKKLLLFLIPLAILSSCKQSCGTDYAKLNKEAAERYMVPIRQGGVNGQQFWNEFSDKFTYVPSFDFPELEGAVSYRFDFWHVSDVLRVMEDVKLKPYSERPSAEEKLAQYNAESEYLCSFTADSPKALLSPVWESLPVGYTGLVVTAIDAEGKDMKPVATREFLRDYPFNPPYPEAPRSYREAAYKALRFMDSQKVVQACRANTIDERARLIEVDNLYACKFVHAAIRCEIALAKMDTTRKEMYLQTAHNAADWLIEHAEPADAPLAYFPPTYYKTGYKFPQTMAMEANMVMSAFFDLYDYTGEQKYFDFALNIGRTYDKLIDERGFLPKKLWVETGKGINDVGALMGDMLMLLLRIHNQYGITEFDDMFKRCETWMNNDSMVRFEMSGQFEDGRVTDLYPYQNLTNIMPNNYAEYLLNKPDRTDEDIKASEDFIRFVEDQFIHWDLLYDKYGVKRYFTPGVYEQYWCPIPIDGSAATTVRALLDYYEATGDELTLEKARTLVNSIVISQNSITGEIPTFWSQYATIENFWVNCAMGSVNTLLRFADLIGEPEWEVK